MGKPSEEDEREMEALKHLVKYGAKGNLKDHELWGLIKKVEEYGTKSREKGWEEEDLKNGPELDDLKELTIKLFEMIKRKIPKEI